MSEKTAYIKLIRGVTHTCPDGTKILAKKPSGPFPMSHPLVKYAERNKHKLQIVAKVTTREPSRRARGGRGGSRMPSTPAPVERADVEFGADKAELMTLTRALLIKRNVTFDLEVSIKSGMTKKDIVGDLFDAEQAMLREPDVSIDNDDDEPDDEPDDGDENIDDEPDDGDEPENPPRRRRRRRTPDTDNDEGDDA